MTTMFELLSPRPQRINPSERSWTVPQKVRLYLASDPLKIRPIAQRLAKAWEEIGHQVEWTAYAKRQGCRFDADIVIKLSPEQLSRPQSYRLAIEESGIVLIASDKEGLFYGVLTLCQLIELWSWSKDKWGDTWSGAMISDWPDFRDRGVMLDVSRDKVPQMKTLYKLVDQLARWKINQIQLYMEHTFAYEGHEEVWKDASPFTGEEILALDAYCRERFIDLVPNQNSFGHMHRWLIHDTYRPLAECPDGIDHPFSPNREPYSLCPTDPASLALLDDLYGQLLPNFSSKFFNVGLDETFDVGLGRSEERGKEIGAEGLYVEFLQEIHKRVRSHGMTMQFWSDIILKKPERIEELPDDGIALIWGYEDSHPFEEQCEAFAKFGLGHYVCPGTSAWNSWAGRTKNTLGNLANAASSGKKSGALGFLITDWGDLGHMQPLPVSYLGFLAGASMSWNASEAERVDEIDWPGLLDTHVFRDKAGVMGKLAYELGDIYRIPGGPTFNASPLFRMLVLAETRPPSSLDGLTKEGLEKAKEEILKAIQPLMEADMERADAETIVKEFRWCADILLLACNFGFARMKADEEDPASLPEVEKQPLLDELKRLRKEHRNNWMTRYREGGFVDSEARLITVENLIKG